MAKLIRYEELPAADRKAVDRKLRRKKASWSNAQPVTTHGIHFPSKLEAQVYSRLLRELIPGERLFRQVRLSLLTIAPREDGTPLYLKVDFAIVVGHNKIQRLIDAKGRKSRDWDRGKAACEAMYEVKIEEVTR